MAINNEVRMRVSADFEDSPGRQEFILSVGSFGNESTYYVGRDQMTAFKKVIDAALIEGERREREYRENELRNEREAA